MPRGASKPVAVGEQVSGTISRGGTIAAPVKEGKKGTTRGRVYQKIHDRTEEYVYVTRDDLREIRAIGWLEQGLFGVGTFLFSGAFWLFFELLAHQEHGKFEFTAWMGMCIVSMSAGLALGIVGLVMFSLRQKRLNKYFPKESDILL